MFLKWNISLRDRINVSLVSICGEVESHLLFSLFAFPADNLHLLDSLFFLFFYIFFWSKHVGLLCILFGNLVTNWLLFALLLYPDINKTLVVIGYDRLSVFPLLSSICGL